MRVRGIPVLDFYIVRELLAPFGLGTVLFTFFLLVDRIYSLTDLVVTKGVPFHLVAQLLVYTIPAFLAPTLPMAFLVAVLLAGGRLAADLEVVAFKAAGVSLVRIFRPVLVAGLVVTLATGALTLVLGPLANREFQRQLFRLLQTRAVAGIKERVFNSTFGDVVLYIEEISPSQVALHGVLVSDERDPRLSRIITAREGRLLTDGGNLRTTLRLLDGGINEADVLPTELPPGVRADGARFRGTASRARYRYTAFKVYDMALTIDAPLRGTREFQKPEKDLPLADLYREMRAPGEDRPRRAAFAVEWHKRFALPVAALVFALVGFPLAARSHRGGRSVALVGSLVILVSYYLVMTSLEGAALRLRLSPAFAMWFPDALFGVIGLVLLTATAREWRLPRTRRVWPVMSALRALRPRRRSFGVERLHPTSRQSTLLIDRYVLRSHATFIALGLVVASALFVLIDLLQTLDKYLRTKPPLLYILEHFVYRLPATLHDSMPIVMLISTIFLFLTLSRNHELTALKAAGVSLYRVSAPVLLLAFGIAVGSSLFQELVLPVLNERGEEVDRVKIRGQLPRHLQTRARLWLRSGESRFYRVELLNPGTSDMYGLTVIDLDRGFQLLRRFDARHAQWTGGGWEVTDGAVRELGPNGEVQTTVFAKRMLNLAETIEDLSQVQKPMSAMSYLELRDYLGRLQAAGFEVRKYLVELYSRLSFPLGNLIMALVAIPFALQAPRGGRLFGVALAIAIMAAYMVVHYVALAFARADLLPPLLAAWTSNVIFAGIGVSLFLSART